MTTDINNECVTTLRSPWHLRRTPTPNDTVSHLYPGGDRVELLAEVPQMVRGASEKGYNVRVVADGQTGFAFVPVADIPEACRSGSSALARASLVERIFPPSSGIVKAVGGPSNAAIVTAIGVASVGYYFYRRSKSEPQEQVPRYSLASNPRRKKNKHK